MTDEGKACGRGKPLPYGVTGKTFDTGGPGGPPAVDGVPISSAGPGAQLVGAQIFPCGTRGGSIGGAGVCYGSPIGAQRQRVRLGEDEQGSEVQFSASAGNEI